MTPTELKEFLLEELQFHADEVTDVIASKVAKDALRFYNRYRPKIDKEFLYVQDYTYTFVTNVPDYVLRLYHSSDTEFWDYDLVESKWKYIRPTLMNLEWGNYVMILGYRWSLEDITIEDPEFENVISLMIAKTKKRVANYRRTVERTDSPYDLKGDAFYQESLTEESEAEEAIKDNMNTFY